MNKYLSALFALSLLAGCGDGNELVKPEPGCIPESAEIFTDCFSTTWSIVVEDRSLDALFIGASGVTDNITWAVNESSDNEHDQVIDVNIHQETDFSVFSFRPIYESTNDTTSIDLTEYENGYFVFDLKVLDYGLSELGIFTYFQCGWPCRSQYMPIANLSGQNAIAPEGFPVVAEVDQWVTIKLPMQYLQDDNLSETDPDLDLTLVNSIFIGPVELSETEQKDVHYQIDNIRFER